MAAGPVARGGVAGDLRRPGAVPVLGLLCLFFWLVRARCGVCLCKDIPETIKRRHGAKNGLCGGFVFWPLSLVPWPFGMPVCCPIVAPGGAAAGGAGCWDTAPGAHARGGPEMGKRKPPQFSPGRWVDHMRLIHWEKRSRPPSNL